MMDAKPKVMRYAEAVADAERRIIEAVPDILDALVAKAKDGDTKAALYLLDRVLGRPAGTKHPPAEDRRLPFDDVELDEAVRKRKRRADILALTSFGEG